MVLLIWMLLKVPSFKYMYSKTSIAYPDQPYTFSPNMPNVNVIAM